MLEGEVYEHNVTFTPMTDPNQQCKCSSTGVSCQRLDIRTGKPVGKTSKHIMLPKNTGDFCSVQVPF